MHLVKRLSVAVLSLVALALAVGASWDSIWRITQAAQIWGSARAPSPGEGRGKGPRRAPIPGRRARLPQRKSSAIEGGVLESPPRQQFADRQAGCGRGGGGVEHVQDATALLERKVVGQRAIGAHELGPNA